MNLTVCVKYVPDATADRRFTADNTVERAPTDGLLSELDEYAVEQALRIRDELGGDTEVTVLTVGPRQAVDAIRKALQMGADKGVHVLDDAIAGADAVATSRVLAEAVRKLPHDLVLCGMASTDGGMGVIPAMLSEWLDLPGATFGSEVTVADGKVTVRRDVDAVSEVIEADLPCVLSVTDQSGEPRYPSFKGIMAAKKKPVQTWSLEDLGIPAGETGLAAAWTAVEAIQARPPRAAGEVVKDEDGSGATALADFLTARKFI